MAEKDKRLEKRNERIKMRGFEMTMYPTSPTPPKTDRADDSGDSPGQYVDLSAILHNRMAEMLAMHQFGAAWPGPGGGGKPFEAEIVRKRLEDDEKSARRRVNEWILRTKHTTKFDDIVGNEAAHAALREAIVGPVANSEVYKRYGKRPTRGILLSGPPGCGKTLFGKAAAQVIAELHGADEVSMISIKANALESKFVGETEERIRAIFAYARAYKALHGHQLVIFIDEADSMLPNRAGNPLPWTANNVATFLSEMDGLDDSGALVILATNRPEAIDPAVLRDGRVDRNIVVRRPNEAAAREILRKALSGDPTADTVDDLIVAGAGALFDPFRKLLRLETTNGVDHLRMSDTVSGALVVGIVERAKSHAIARDIESGTATGVTSDDLVKAVDDAALENAGRIDNYALQEYCERTGAGLLSIEILRQDIRLVAERPPGETVH
jgi:SpoVK/Ycf46/Vps4 family AAA+-type ATPase